MYKESSSIITFLYLAKNFPENYKGLVMAGHIPPLTDLLSSPPLWERRFLQFGIRCNQIWFWISPV